MCTVCKLTLLRGDIFVTLPRVPPETIKLMFYLYAFVHKLFSFCALWVSDISGSRYINCKLFFFWVHPLFALKVTLTVALVMKDSSCLLTLASVTLEISIKLKWNVTWLIFLKVFLLTWLCAIYREYNISTQDISRSYQSMINLKINCQSTKRKYSIYMNFRWSICENV